MSDRQYVGAQPFTLLPIVRHCPMCEGSGTANDAPCPFCNGTGHLVEQPPLITYKLGTSEAADD